MNATYVGRSGGTTDRFYWVDVRFPCCDGPLLGPVQVTTPADLDYQNVVMITWDAEPGATHYNLLSTPDTVVPAPGSQTLVTTTTTNGYTDIGQPLTTYPATPATVDRPKPGTKIDLSAAYEKQLADAEKKLAELEKQDPPNQPLIDAWTQQVQVLKDRIEEEKRAAQEREKKAAEDKAKAKKPTDIKADLPKHPEPAHK